MKNTCKPTGRFVVSRAIAGVGDATVVTGQCPGDSRDCQSSAVTGTIHEPLASPVSNST